MTKLKLSSVQDEKPVKLTVTLPAALHRDLVAYAEVLAREAGQNVEPAKLIAPMLASFIASDREFAKARNGETKSPAKSPALARDATPPPWRAPD
jgi:hypothetical protein